MGDANEDIDGKQVPVSQWRIGDIHVQAWEAPDGTGK